MGDVFGRHVRRPMSWQASSLLLCLLLAKVPIAEAAGGTVRFEGRAAEMPCQMQQHVLMAETDGSSAAAVATWQGHD